MAQKQRKPKLLQMWKGQTKPKTQNSPDAELVLHVIHEGELIFKPSFDLELTDGALP